MNDGTEESAAIACDMSVFPAGEREPLERRSRYLLNEAAQRREELPDGYAFTFAAEEYDNVVTFIGNERRCCPFFHFALEVAPQNGALTLRITGSAEAKALLASGLEHMATQEVGTPWAGFAAPKAEGCA